jgi:twitching motility protein PilJ
VRAIDNIYQAGLSACHIKQLEQFEVKAKLVAPIIKENELLGLLIAHQCSKPRVWQQAEIDLFTQLATQIGFALDQASLLEQVETARQQAEIISQEQRRQKELLQQQLVELLTQIEGAASGDLTVRAKQTAGEIGTIAEFFNSIIESLRQLVTQVKKAAGQVNISVGENAGAIRELADEALKQAQEINHTLDSVEQMTLSIQAVATSANQAAEVAHTAFATAEAGGVAMDRTVESIFNLRDTVTETATQVKLLGESTQQISKVVSLINQIALQTNVLAINASIEASRAGEAGRGFTVVAEEIGQLAAKSAAATKEIEQIVESIQLETSKVVRAMELGNHQVIAGAHFVEDSKQSLGQILEESHQIYQLVQSISSATVSQAETAQAVTNLMKEIADVSEGTSEYSRQISNSLQRTVEVAQQLQVTVGTFKVGDEPGNYIKPN